MALRLCYTLLLHFPPHGFTAPSSFAFLLALSLLSPSFKPLYALHLLFHPSLSYGEGRHCHETQKRVPKRYALNASEGLVSCRYMEKGPFQGKHKTIHEWTVTNTK